MRFLKAGQRYVNVDAITDAVYKPKNPDQAGDQSEIQIWSQGNGPAFTVFGDGADRVKAFLDAHVLDPEKPEGRHPNEVLKEYGYPVVKDEADVPA